jgi:superfamily II DNA helicase RecQ
MSDLLHKFGVKGLKDFQQESVDNLLEGKDVSLSVKTGGGKSLCYQAFHVFWTESFTFINVILID